MKDCVLCLFLCVASNAVSQVIDTSLVSLAVSSQVVELAESLEKMEKGTIISGDSSIIRYIPAYYQRKDIEPTYILNDLRTGIEGKYITIEYGVFRQGGDFETGYVYNSKIDSDSLRKNYVAPIYPEEDFFWGNTLQPILVTAGAAAVIALFFFVKF